METFGGERTPGPFEPRVARDQFASLLARFKKDRDSARLIRERTDLVDDIVRRVVEGTLCNLLRVPFAMVAVGGYGRCELFPYSDVDLLLLFANDGDIEGTKSALSECWRILWDSGLRVSHSVRTIAECVRLNEQNTELHVSLLDARFLIGEQALFDQLKPKLGDFFEKHAGKLTRRLSELARERHAKYNDTVYHLEPHIKEGPGGIRDLHLLRWLSQLNPRQQTIQECIAELDEPRAFLFALRTFVHVQTGRDNNLLSFELQDRVAEQLPPHPEVPEQWMRQYYAHARAIYQPALRALDQIETSETSLLGQIRGARNRLSTSDFTVSKDRVFLRNPAGTLSSPEALFALFTFVARHGIKLSWDAQRRLRASVGSIAETLRKHQSKRESWRELFSEPQVALALREMQETGVLTAVLPEWHEVDSLVVRDFYHRYTVDEHTFVAIETIDKLLDGKSGATGRFHDLAAEEEDVAVLRFAILLHDIGKGTLPGDHVAGSVAAAKVIMDRLGVPEDKQAEVIFLIDHHLDLSLIMTSRDLEDPATARYLTSRVGTQERLRRLALLTFADISAVNPTAMTPWRLEQLWRVYVLGQEQLTRELVTDKIQAGPQLTAILHSVPHMAGFLEGLPTRYLRTHTRAEIHRHHELHRHAATQGVAVHIAREASAYVLSVVAKDQPGLFAKLCGGLSSFGMSIVKAEAFSNNAGFAVDVFRFSDPLRTLELNPGETERLQWTVECIIRGTLQVEELLKRRRRTPVPSSGAKVIPRVRFNNEASDHSTLIDFVAEDRPGLLYDLASALSNLGCDIEVVLIDTEAHRALDVFYVTKDRGKLSPELQRTLEQEFVGAGLKA